jgi:hypothetical protein
MIDKPCVGNLIIGSTKNGGSLSAPNKFDVGLFKIEAGRI